MFVLQIMNLPSVLRIGTRGSPLALAQTNEVKQAIINCFPQYHNHNIEIVPIVSKGDLIQDRKLLEIGNKSLFTGAIEEKLLSGDIDLAVHSMKDVPSILPEDLSIVAVLKRNSPYDALILQDNFAPDEDYSNLIIGTSSIRREQQIYAMYPKVKFLPLRGNINTRLVKLENEDFNCTIMAEAGLKRLGLDHVIRYQVLYDMIPAIGQGAIGVEILSVNEVAQHICKTINHVDTMLCVNAERHFLHLMNGSCHIPVGGYADIQQGNTMRIKVFFQKNNKNYFATYQDDIKNSLHIAEYLARQITDSIAQQKGSV